MNRRPFAATFFAVAAFLGPLHAGEIPWTDSSYYHFAQSQQLEDLIRDFTAIQGIDVVIDPELSGTVNGIFEAIPPGDFWDNLSKAYNLCWFYDGSILYVYPGSSISTQVIPMGPQEGNALKAIVGEMDFASSSCSLRYMLPSKMMILSGPPRFLEVVQGLLDSIQVNTIQNFVDETVVQIFPLKYAFAYDVSLSVGTGEGVTIEGIATLLQRILSGINSIPQTSQEAVSLAGVANGQPVEGMIQRKEQQASQEQGSRSANGESGKGREPAERKTAAAPKESKQPTRSSESGTAAGGTGNPLRQSQITSITYDARLNAVIVRDHRELMPFYQSLIERFDVPTKAVEIQVAIVDVDVGHSREIGLDVVQFLNGGQELTWRPTAGDSDVNSKKTNFFAKLNNVLSGYDIATRLKALEGLHAAKTLSRPSVLTLDNLAAVISRSDQTYVSVAGAYSAELFTVSASVALRVIPHIIEVEKEDGKTERQIKLFVSIEDGSMDVAGAMPTVSSSQINTQTILLEGQSLVVGGYYQERHNDTKRGVPLLQDIPLIGRLFSLSSKDTMTIERLFIISPRIIELTAEDGDPYAQFFQKTQLTGQPLMTMEDFRVEDRPPTRIHRHIHRP